MPRYLVTRDTLIAHESRVVRADTEVTIEWPNGAEPKLGENLVKLQEPKKTKGDGKVSEQA